jgi:mannose-1-phosphate guanylyltransferase
LIFNEDGFRQTCTEALKFTAHIKALVTLGIKPHQPNTGYGYIQHESHAVSQNVYKVKTFTEKPDLALAKTFVASGDFLWNAGIFVWQVKNILKAFEKHLPEMFEVFDLEKQHFNTKKKKPPSKKYIRNASIFLLIMASWKKRIMCTSFQLHLVGVI